jgi:hypothetical protein
MNAVVETHPEPQDLPVSEGAALIQAIERAVLNPQIDVEKMERLFALQERMMARQAETAYNASMSAAQAEIPTIRGTRKNTQTNSFYADLVDVCDTATPIITKHGFSLSFGQADCPTQGELRVTCRCSHAGGHSRDYYADLPIDMTGIKGAPNKTPIQGKGSTFSYAQRYLTKLIFNLRIEGEDNDGNTRVAQTITEKEATDLKAKAEEVGADQTAFLQFFRIGTFSELPAAKLKQAVGMLNEKARRAR